MEEMPRVSVVITWRHESASLADMLRVQWPRHDSLADLDMIVVTAEPASVEVTEMFPDLRFIAAPAETPVGVMRSMGFAQALGTIVMLVDGTPDADLVVRARELVS